MSRSISPIIKGASFSPDRMYRYSLWRMWDSRKPALALFGVNPSVANEFDDDMTIAKGIGFASRWGMGGLYMLNPFAFVATNPAGMVAALDPVGPDNDRAIKNCLQFCGRFVVAWGSLKPQWRMQLGWQQRTEDVLKMINREVYCLGRTKDGSPRHPSRISYATELEVFWRPAA